MPELVPTYPPARGEELVEDLHGHRVSDPYRWLEDGQSEETLAWAAAKDQLWEQHRGLLAGPDTLRARLDDLSVGVIGAPQVRGDHRRRGGPAPSGVPPHRRR